MGREIIRNAVTAFPSAIAADRPIAGVAAAARAVRRLVDEGAASVVVRIGDGGELSPDTRADIERLRGTTEVKVETGTGPEHALPRD